MISSDVVFAAHFCFALKGRMLPTIDNVPSQICGDGINYVALLGQCVPDKLFPPIGVSIRVHRSKWRSEPPEVKVLNTDWLSPFFSEQDQDLRNWHRDSDGRMCWIYPKKWQSICASMETPEDAVRAALQMAKDVTVLLVYHIEAYRHRYLKWREEWDFHPHGN